MEKESIQYLQHRVNSICKESTRNSTIINEFQIRLTKLESRLDKLFYVTISSLVGIITILFQSLLF